MVKVVVVYLAPIYLALSLFVWLSPEHSWRVLLNFTWVLMLVLSVLWSVAQNAETAAEQLAPKSVDCPSCGRPNAADRVLCEECLTELFELDDQGNLVPIPPLSQPPASQIV